MAAGSHTQILSLPGVNTATPPHTRNGTLKKFALLAGFVVFALVVDGTLSYDIFDARPETFKMWIVLAMIAILGLVVVVADSSKNTDHDQDDSR